VKTRFIGRRIAHDRPDDGFCGMSAGMRIGVAGAAAHEAVRTLASVSPGQIMEQAA
jgi:hypothetical protein